MPRKLFRKYTYDISLDEGAGEHLIIWVTGLMVFFVTLALAINFGLSTITKSWVTGLSGTLTVEIKPPFSSTEGETITPQTVQKFEESVKQVMTLLDDSSAVSEARLLSQTEIESLIEPWMGRGEQMDAIPLPALIDVKLTPNADVVKLQSDLKTIEPSATIDSHTDTLDDVKTLVNTATLFMLLLTGVIVALAVASISGIVRSKLLIHQSEVETLHLIGASDEYIARQFRHYTLRDTIKGALIGLGCTLVTLAGLGAVTYSIESNIFPHVHFIPLQWITLLLLPIISGSLIAHLTAQATVLKELSRLP